MSYFNNNISYGYINFDFTNQNPVLEVSITQNGKSLYERIVSDIDLFYNYEKQDFEKKLYYMGALQYAVALEDKENVVLYSDGLKEEITSENVDSSETVYDSSDALFSKSYVVNGAITVTSPTYTCKYNKTKSLISLGTIDRLTGKYACAVLALTEIANQEGVLKNDSIADSYNQLWKDTESTVEKTVNDIKCGVTLDDMIKSGMKQYLSARGKGNSKITDKKNPGFAFFKDMIESNSSGTLTYRIMTKDEGKTGHTVNVVGYCVARLNGVFSNYLIVADGWNADAPRYINLTSADFVNSYGVKYVIK